MDPFNLRWRLVLLVAGIMSLSLIPLTAAADGLTADEQQFVDLINAERKAVGASTLVVVPELTVGARAQAQAMADAGEIFHNQNLGDLIDGWHLLGENVGFGGDVESLHAAFMASPGHRENLLKAVYDGIGVGVVWSGGLPYVSEVFMHSIAASQPFTPPFSDDDGSLHEADIISLFERGITMGCGDDRYCPDRSVSRAEMATFMVRAFDLPGSAGDEFSDDDGSPHEAAIQALAARGVTKGCGPSLFCPDRSVTRGEMATFLTRLLSLEAADSAGFTDIGSSQHGAAIDSLASAGITQGCSSTRFCPDAHVTRAQMATFLIRALER